MPNPRYGEGPDFRKALIDAVGWIRPKWIRQIAEDMSDHLGEQVCERRVYRQIKPVIKEGMIVRTDRGYLRSRKGLKWQTSNP